MRIYSAFDIKSNTNHQPLELMTKVKRQQYRAKPFLVGECGVELGIARVNNNYILHPWTYLMEGGSHFIHPGFNCSFNTNPRTLTYLGTELTILKAQSYTLGRWFNSYTHRGDQCRQWDQQKVIHPRFRIYWAFTILTTALVFVVWVFNYK